MMTNMKRNHRLSILFMSGLLLLGGSVLTGCDSDELDTNPYNKSGVNLVAFGPCPLTRLDNMRITGTQLNKVDKVLFPQGNSKIDEATNYNNGHQNQHIFLDNNTDNWTWEKCFYILNQETLNSLITVDENADYLFNGNNYGKVLGKMLNNKVDTAYAMLNSEFNFVIPQYIQDAIKWLNE